MKKFLAIIITILVVAFGIYLLVSFNERQIYLSELTPDYIEVGYYDLGVNEDYDGNELSLLVDDEEKTFDNGFFVHAHSTLVFDGLKDYNPKMFSVYLGVNQTARNNGNTSIKFMIYFDQELVYESDEINGDDEAIFVELEMNKVNRITLVVDDLGGNGNDHAVWADPLLIYRGGKELA